LEQLRELGISHLFQSVSESDRNKEKMMEILEDRGLSFLFPMLRIQNDLWRQIQKDPNAGNLYKWIKENVDQRLHRDKGFINILATL
jgi:translation initiation factor 4G